MFSSIKEDKVTRSDLLPHMAKSSRFAYTFDQIDLRYEFEIDIQLKILLADSIDQNK